MPRRVRSRGSKEAFVNVSGLPSASGGPLLRASAQPHQNGMQTRTNPRAIIASHTRIYARALTHAHARTHAHASSNAHIQTLCLRCFFVFFSVLTLTLGAVSNMSPRLRIAIPISTSTVLFCLQIRVCIFTRSHLIPFQFICTHTHINKSPLKRSTVGSHFLMRKTKGV